MPKQPRRARRVQLSTPGSSDNMINKAAASAADHVFLDLEDACAPNQKVAARTRVCDALNGLDWGKKVRCVRINDLSTEYAYEDIITVVEGARENVDTLMLTKVKQPADVLFADTLLSMMEKKLKLKKRIGLEALVEEVEALQCIDEIARSTDRLECLVFGMGDFSASMGIDLQTAVDGSGGYPGDIWHYARFRLGVACRAAGIDAVDGPYADYRNEAGYLEQCRRVCTLGFAGKWAIHPSQIAPGMRAFSPDPDKVDQARRMVRAYAEAERQGLGAVEFDGVMIDVATVRLVRSSVLAKADLYGM